MYLFSIVGIITLSYLILKFLRNVAYGLKVYFFPTYPDFSKFGKWSVITGSTDGIGKAIAFQLASKGQNILLISRNEEKLKNVQNELKSEYAVETKYLAIDFSDDEHIYPKICECVEDMDVGVLVNNVGMTVPDTCFLAVPNLSAYLRNITRVNMFSVFKMTQIILPGMVQRKRGLILNISSVISVKPLQGHCAYGASKAFVDYFSQALSYEYEDKGIIVQSCLPGLVMTNMAKNAKEVSIPFSTRTPSEYAASVLATVGMGRATFGCWQHALMGWYMRLLPMGFINSQIKKRLNEPTDENKTKRE